MGLCKCPKRRVTNQFCFEHRVCVCENCMVTNHPICIVQSYLQWLQDSDYNSICELCTKELNIEDSIRLTCYHVFHWSCLDNFSRQLPATTAPRGYVCPSCKTPLFPPSNLISPVADVLKEKLAGVNWARAGLGLPLLSEEREVKAPVILNTMTKPKPTSPVLMSNGSHSIVDVDEQVPFIRNPSDSYQTSSNRRVFQDIRDVKSVPFDHDDDKYKRRLTVVRNWWNLTFGPTRRGGKALYKRYFLLGTIFIIGIVLIFIFLSKVGRHYANLDPSLDMENNHDLKVQKVWE
ncbi:zinc finger protein-like 1 homolog [Coccinella septempunctata]|uniref:zinc finger protein-like 1 homolog n=1 Tax=Coccinella septempunctata TaxID=41139 RepID=UPI001D0722DC|nr:zinc finger protein-like 1 homolog [Coccinella septempunctata]